MPLIITNPLSGPLGPGFQIGVQRLEGIDISWHWVTTIVWHDEQGFPRLWQFNQKSNGGLSQDLVLLHGEFGEGFEQGGNLDVTIQLLDTTDDQVDVVHPPLGTYQYDGQTNVAPYLQSETTGGLTTEQAQQLEGTAETSVVAELTDALTLTELTSGPTGNPLVVQLNSVTFGVIVRLTTIPAGLVPQTPDNQYWVKTLAVVRVFRGNDLWIRAPIHTPTKIVPFEKEGLVVWVANATLTQWLLNIRVLVDFLPGVTGQVYQMHFP